ncbi:uncharacterized protein AMSG_03268 [Thecamonas trahens ATCC 50062]|uniref:Phospholipid/glycerol acyltransferase domain-containing protein n=1 Tax=Thecamonas trahens ATCC 50062 TaxID=461836 RepID=A0A0L0D694_THETB|nr:hypothetical protein AMSG_03268 [Thecamonas trahens ATCC 50062]KNC46838.1 hypothetical protein AMSG_03268 [Thecamonas trahens ATCC 50062]|eukprot:XP_013760111.1 hypothetical protein AMSG_03268 [Thecamonas trahens ATCC 50062]
MAQLLLLTGLGVVGYAVGRVAELAGIKRASRAAATYFAHLAAVFTVAAVRWWCRVRVRMSAESRQVLAAMAADHRGGVILVNHPSYADALVLGSVLSSMEDVGTRCLRYVSIRYLLASPHAWLQALRGDVFVAGGAREAAASAVRAGAADCASPDKHTHWMLVAPEGAVMTAALAASSQRWAASRGRPPLRLVLYPRTLAVGEAMRVLAANAALHDVYDITLCYPGGHGPRVVDILFPQHDRGLTIDVAVVRHDPPPKESLVSEDALEDWLYTLFAGKDAALQAMVEAGAHSRLPPSGFDSGDSRKIGQAA